MKFSFTLLAILFSSVASSQADFIVTNKLDTLYGKIGFLNLSDDVSIKTQNDRFIYHPYQLSLVCFENDIYRRVIFRNNHTLGKEIAKGNLSLYLIKDEGGYEFSKELLIKENGDALEVPRFNFKKIVSSFLSECSHLSSEISDRRLKKSDLKNIIEQYNSCNNYDNSL